MRKFFPIGLVAILIIAMAISGCGSGGKGNSGGPGGTTYTPGQQSSYTVGGITFYMCYAPSGSFTSDDNIVNGGGSSLPTTVTVNNSYWIAQTDVTYQLWSTVYTWATTTASNKYTFADAGVEGSSGSGSNLQPVTTISWRDAMLWCNALTEYYNSQNGTNYACVYCTDITYSTPIRSVDNSSSVANTQDTEDNPCVNPNAKGFRLPTSGEWELAARYQDGTNWTPGNHVSGDNTGPCYTESGSGVSSVFGNYAWYNGNCSSSMHVGQKTANSLGLYDMSGNVFQCCFDWYLGESSFVRVMRGGSWFHYAHELQLGFVSTVDPYVALYILGFRPVRTQ